MSSLSASPSGSSNILAGSVGLDGVGRLPRRGMVQESLRLFEGDIGRAITIASIPTVSSKMHLTITSYMQSESYGPLGHKWRHSYEASLLAGPSLVTVSTGGGQQFDYIPDGLGGWTLDLSTSMYQTHQLTNPSGSLWEMKTMPEETIWRFDTAPLVGYPETAGRLTELEDRHGNVITLHYSSGKLTSLEEPQGRTLLFGYTGELLTSVTDPNSETTYLTYDGFDNLASVSGPEGCTVTFGYEIPQSHTITSVTDAKGQTSRYHFIADKVAWLTYPAGETLSLRYLWDSQAPLEWTGDYVTERFKTTQVVQPDGQVFEYRFDPRGNLWRTISPSGHIQRFYWSTQQRFLYASEGFPLFRDSLYGPSDNVFNRYSWHTTDEDGNTTATMDPNGLADTFVYDFEGRMLVHHPGQVHQGVQGDWPPYYGRDGVVLCAFQDDDSDVYRAPDYLDSDLDIAITNGDGGGGNEFVRDNKNATSGIIDPRAPVLGDGSIKSSVGYWTHTGALAPGATLEFSVNLTESKAFNLSLYSHSADHPKMAISPMRYYEQFGRDVTFEVEDIHGVQSYRIHNNAPGVWVTFPVEGDVSHPVKVTVRASGNNNQPVLSAIAFDPHHDRRTFYEYSDGKLAKVRNALGHETSYLYNLDGTLASVTDACGKVTSFAYLDSHKNLTKVIDDDSNETLMSYDANGNVLTTTDALGNVTAMTYDGKNRLLTITDALHNVTEFEYDPHGNISSITDAKNRRTLFTYNSLEQLIEVENALGEKLSMTYDANGRLSSQTDSRGLTTRYGYTAEGLLCRVDTPDGERTTMSYDALYRLVALTSPNGNQERLELMNLVGAGNLFRNPGFENTDPISSAYADHWSHTGTRNTTEVHSGEASVSLGLNQQYWTQEQLFLPEGAKFAAAATVKRDRFDFVMEARVRDFRGGTLSRTQSESLAREKFDDWAKTEPLIFEVPGDAQTTPSNPTGILFRARPVLENSLAGWMDDMELFMLSQSYRHDKKGALKSVTTPDGAKISLHYDRLGRVNAFEDPKGERTTLTYDVRDRVTSLTKPSAETLKFSYNEVGALVSFLDGKSQETTFAYDNLHRLATVTYPDSSSEEFAYDPVSNLSSYTDNAEQTVEFDYDEVNRLETITYEDSTTVEMTYDEVGNILTLTERNKDHTEFEYDDLDRMTKITRTKGLGNSTPEWELHHSYDANGNRTSLSDGSGELWRAWGFEARYGAARYGQAYYGGSYDSMNRPLGVSKGGATHASFRYDHEGRRHVVEYANGARTDVFFDIMGRPLELATGKGASTLLKASYGYDIASNRTRQVTGNDTFDYRIDEDGKLTGESVNRMVFDVTEELAKGELDLLELQENGMTLLALDDDFTNPSFNCDRWSLDYQRPGGHPATVIGAETRQDEGLRMRFPRGYSNRTVYRDDYHLINDDYGTISGLFSSVVEHRARLTGDFDLRFDLAELQSYIGGGAWAGLTLSTNHLAAQNSGPALWVEVGADGKVYARTNSLSGNMTIAALPATLRCVRSGSTVLVYLWNEATSTWQTQPNWNFSLTNQPLWIRLGISVMNDSIFATFKNFFFNVASGQTHATSGSYITSVYDAGRNVAWDTLSWQESLPVGTDLKLQLAVSDSIEGPWSYVGPDGTSGTYFSTASGESVGPSVISRYCRVKAYLEGDGSVTPTLERLELSYSGSLPSSYQTFAYDTAGNLTEKQRSTSTGTVTERRSYNNLNEIVDNEIDDGATPIVWTYSHDDNGNLTQKTDGTDTWDYTWDEDNRLVGVEKNSAPVVTYEYDSASRMIQRVEGGTTTNYHWDGWDLIHEEKTGVINETTNYLVPFGEVLAFERGGDWYYLHGDALSSTQLVTDESGDVVGRYVYGAWGEELVSSESIPGLFENRFVSGLGCRRDSATGLVYMRHRWYDPQLQRFISRDPIGFEGGWNLYEYAGNNPVNLTDPYGLLAPNPIPPQVIAVPGAAQALLAGAVLGKAIEVFGPKVSEYYYTTDPRGPRMTDPKWDPKNPQGPLGPIMEPPGIPMPLSQPKPTTTPKPKPPQPPKLPTGSGGGGGRDCDDQLAAAQAKLRNMSLHMNLKFLANAELQRIWDECMNDPCWKPPSGHPYWPG